MTRISINSIDSKWKSARGLESFYFLLAVHCVPLVVLSYQNSFGNFLSLTHVWRVPCITSIVSYPVSHFKNRKCFLFHLKVWKKCSLGLDSEFHFFLLKWDDGTDKPAERRVRQLVVNERNRAEIKKISFSGLMFVAVTLARSLALFVGFSAEKVKTVSAHQHKSKQMSSDESFPIRCFRLLWLEGVSSYQFKTAHHAAWRADGKQRFLNGQLHARDQSRRVYECLMIIYAHRWDSRRFALWSGLRLLSHRKKNPPAASSTTQEARKRIRW